MQPEKEVINTLAKVVMLAARTAPKAKGEDDIVMTIVREEDKEALAREMKKISERKGKGFEFFKRDAESVIKSDCIILIGLKFKRTLKLDCGACGFTCAEILEQDKKTLDFTGPLCAIKLLDLGIALGSAAFQAKQLCIDNRIMYSIGVAAKKLKLIDAEIVMGLPLSVSGKNIYFDRKK